MIRKAISQHMVLAAVALVSSALAVGCSKKADSDDIGSVGLALTLPGGDVVNSVHYAITPTTPPVAGDIDVSGPGVTQATALVSGLAAGSYTVTMTATTTMNVPCMGSSPFTVAAGQTAMANVTLLCNRPNNNGSVAINGRFNQCPLITGLSATALQAPAGGTITVNAAVSELDPGDTVTYAWTSSNTAAGTLAPLNAATAVFTCSPAGGSTSLSITVSDGLCGDTRTGAIPITCIPGAPGGSGGGGTAGGGSGGGGTAGGGSGGGGTAGGGSGGGGTAGGGSGGGGTAGGGSGGGGTGGTVCVETFPPAGLEQSCMTCIGQFAGASDGCCGLATLDPTGFALCNTLSQCMRVGGPPTGACNINGDTLACFCGTNGGTCSSNPNGPCLAQATAAAGRDVVNHTTDSPTPAQVVSRYGSTDFAVGRASGIQSFAGGFCPTECGY